MNTQQKLFFEELQLLMQKHNFDLKDVKELVSVTIPLALFNLIRGTHKYSLANGAGLKPIEPKIDLQQFYNHIKSDGSIGFRMYPAFDSTNKNLYFMLAKSVKEVDTSEKFEFFPFKKTDYASLDSSEMIKSESIAKERLVDYFNNVRIEGKQQVNNEFYKKSRYYAVKDFDAFLATNQVTGSLSNYDIKIEFGYITEDISKTEIWVNYKGEFNWPDRKETDHMGFTCIFVLYEKNSNEPKGLALEIGHPCPPQCGSLKW